MASRTMTGSQGLASRKRHSSIVATRVRGSLIMPSQTDLRHAQTMQRQLSAPAEEAEPAVLDDAETDPAANSTAVLVPGAANGHGARSRPAPSDDDIKEEALVGDAVDLRQAFSKKPTTFTKSFHASGVKEEKKKFFERLGQHLGQHLLNFEEPPAASTCDEYQQLHEVIKRGNERDLRACLTSLGKLDDGATLKAACATNEPCSLLYRATLRTDAEAPVIVGTLLELGGSEQLLIEARPTPKLATRGFGKPRARWTPYTRAAVGPLVQSWSHVPVGSVDVEVLLVMLRHGLKLGLEWIVNDLNVKDMWAANEAGAISFLDTLASEFGDSRSIACIALHMSRPAIISMKVSGLFRRYSVLMKNFDVLLSDKFAAASSKYEKVASGLIDRISTEEHIRAFLDADVHGSRDANALGSTLSSVASNNSVSAAGKKSRLLASSIKNVLERKDANGVSIIHIALDNEQKTFLSTPRVQEYLKRYWWGLDDSTVFVNVHHKILVMLFAAVCHCLPPLYFWLQRRSKHSRPVILGVRFMPPAVRFYFDKIFLAIFLLVCSTQLKPLKFQTNAQLDNSRRTEYLLIVYLSGWLLQEAMETFKEMHGLHVARLQLQSTQRVEFLAILKGWAIGQNLWNRLDQLSLFVSWLGHGLRQVEEKYGPMYRPDTYISDYLIPVSLILVWLRFLEMLCIDSNVGPLIQIIIVMLSNDTLNFMKLITLILFARASAVTFVSWSRDDGDELKWSQAFLLSFQILIQGTSLVEPEEWTLDQVFPWVIEVSFGLVVILLMVNLLIAMFSKTFDNISDNATVEFLFMRAEIIQCRDSMVAFQPPFNIWSRGFLLLYHLLRVVVSVRHAKPAQLLARLKGRLCRAQHGEATPTEQMRPRSSRGNVNADGQGETAQRIRQCVDEALQQPVSISAESESMADGAGIAQGFWSTATLGAHRIEMLMMVSDYMVEVDDVDMTASWRQKFDKKLRSIEARLELRHNQKNTNVKEFRNSSTQTHDIDNENGPDREPDSEPSPQNLVFL